MYLVYIDNVLLPVTPSKIQTKIKNQNKTLNLINDGEVTLLKDAGLTEFNFKAIIPHVNYPFAMYPNGFKPADYFLNKFEQLKVRKKPFQFIVSRISPMREYLYDTNIKVSLEDYQIDEDASDGQEVSVTINLKQYKDFGVKNINVKSSGIVTVSFTRPAETAPVIKTYTVKAGDTLWNIAKKYLGDGARYTEIYALNKNKIQNPNLIQVGQVLTIP
jgi:nucleoid-associated protein YgaU